MGVFQGINFRLDILQKNNSQLFFFSSKDSSLDFCCKAFNSYDFGFTG